MLASVFGASTADDSVGIGGFGSSSFLASLLIVLQDKTRRILIIAKRWVGRVGGWLE